MVPLPRTRLWRWSIALAAFLAPASGPTRAQPADPREMKAAITYRIVQFVRVANHDPNTPLDLCVARDEPMERGLHMLRGMAVGKAALRVRTVSGAVTSYRGCHIAYLGTAPRGLADTLSRAGTLTIGEGEEFTSSGGIIGLVKSGRQVRFHINYAAAERSRIRISSKLLRLAVSVVE